MSKYSYWIASNLLNWGISFDFIKHKIKEYERSQASLVKLANDPNFSKDDFNEILRRLPDNPDSERDDEGQTLTLIASSNNHIDIANILLENNADPNITSMNGSVALHNASLRGSSELVQLLIDKKADVNAAKSGGFTALHCSAFKNHDDIISILLKNGANPNAESKFGRTPLHEAAFDGNSKSVEALLKGGALPNAKGYIKSKLNKIKDNDGLTAVHTCCQMHGKKGELNICR